MECHLIKDFRQPVRDRVGTRLHQRCQAQHTRVPSHQQTCMAWERCLGEYVHIMWCTQPHLLCVFQSFIQNPKSEGGTIITPGFHSGGSLGNPLPPTQNLGNNKFHQLRLAVQCFLWPVYYIILRRSFHSDLGV